MFCRCDGDVKVLRSQHERVAVAGAVIIGLERRSQSQHTDDQSRHVATDSTDRHRELIHLRPRRYAPPLPHCKLTQLTHTRRLHSTTIIQRLKYVLSSRITGLCRISHAN